MLEERFDHPKLVFVHMVRVYDREAIESILAEFLRKYVLDIQNDRTLLVVPYEKVVTYLDWHLRTFL